MENCFDMAQSNETVRGGCQGHMILFRSVSNLEFVLLTKFAIVLIVFCCVLPGRTDSVRVLKMQGHRKSMPVEASGNKC